MSPTWKASGSDYSLNWPENSRPGHAGQSFQGICGCFRILYIILHDRLGSKNCAVQIQFSEENLRLCGANSETFLSRIITGDEMWIHHWDPETKHRGSPTPKKFRAQLSAR
jgi:hypothetical protein